MDHLLESVEHGEEQKAENDHSGQSCHLHVLVLIQLITLLSWLWNQCLIKDFLLRLFIYRQFTLSVPPLLVLRVFCLGTCGNSLS